MRSLPKKCAKIKTAIPCPAARTKLDSLLGSEQASGLPAGIPWWAWALIQLKAGLVATNLTAQSQGSSFPMAKRVHHHAELMSALFMHQECSLYFLKVDIRTRVHFVMRSHVSPRLSTVG